MRRNSNSSVQLALAALLMALVPAAAVLAEDAPGAAPQGTPLTNKDGTPLQTLDDVVVTGKLNSLSGIRKAMVDAQDRFYNRWNELNKDPQWNVTCENIAPTGTRIAKRVCDPQKIADEQHDQAMYLLGMGGNVRFTSVEEMRRVINPELKERMLKMVKVDPELMTALLEHAKLVQIYEDTRKKKFTGHLFVND
jgi:hypothetical protein